MPAKTAPVPTKTLVELRAENDALLASNAERQARIDELGKAPVVPVSNLSPEDQEIADAEERIALLKQQRELKNQEAQLAATEAELGGKGGTTTGKTKTETAKGGPKTSGARFRGERHIL